MNFERTQTFIPQQWLTLEKIGWRIYRNTLYYLFSSSVNLKSFKTKYSNKCSLVSTHNKFLNMNLHLQRKILTSLSLAFNNSWKIRKLVYLHYLYIFPFQDLQNVVGYIIISTYIITVFITFTCYSLSIVVLAFNRPLITPSHFYYYICW